MMACHGGLAKRQARQTALTLIKVVSGQGAGREMLSDFFTFFPNV
jgi:hypothetical protein